MKKFPLGIAGQWLRPRDCRFPSAVVEDWLLHTGSLTERLRTHCTDFEVVVAGQGITAISPAEYAALYGKCHRDSSRQTQVREVMLRGDGRPWVFARSLLPAAFVDNCMSEFKQLGSRPLGQILFNDPRFQRQPFDIFYSPPEGQWQRLLGVTHAVAMWGRRSVFVFQSHRLLVIEVFLPEAPAYADLSYYRSAAEPLANPAETVKQ